MPKVFLGDLKAKCQHLQIKSRLNGYFAKFPFLANIHLHLHICSLMKASLGLYLASIGLNSDTAKSWSNFRA